MFYLLFWSFSMGVGALIMWIVCRGRMDELEREHRRRVAFYIDEYELASAHGVALMGQLDGLKRELKRLARAQEPESEACTMLREAIEKAGPPPSMIQED